MASQPVFYFEASSFRGDCDLIQRIRQGIGELQTQRYASRTNHNQSFTVSVFECDPVELTTDNLGVIRSLGKESHRIKTRDALFILTPAARKLFETTPLDIDEINGSYAFIPFDSEWSSTTRPFLDFAYAYMERKIAEAGSLDYAIVKDKHTSNVRDMMNSANVNIDVRMIVSAVTTESTPFSCFMQNPPIFPRSDNTRVLGRTFGAGLPPSRFKFFGEGDLARHPKQTSSDAKTATTTTVVCVNDSSKDVRINTSHHRVDEGAGRKLGR